MFEAAAYLPKDEREERVLEHVDLLEQKDGHIKMVNIFGEQKIMRAKIKSPFLVEHRIILEPL